MPNASNTSDVLERHRGARRDRRAGGHRSAGARSPVARWPTCRPVAADGPPLQRRAFRMGRRHLPGGRHRLHRRGRRGVRRPGRGRAGLLGGGARPGRRTRPGWAPRDTLRLEAGLPLHGHELGPGITPLQAGLGWVVGWDKGAFTGRAALEEERVNGPARRLRGLRGRRAPTAARRIRHRATTSSRSGILTERQLLPDARVRHRAGFRRGGCAAPRRRPGDRPAAGRASGRRPSSARRCGRSARTRNKPPGVAAGARPARARAL